MHLPGIALLYEYSFLTIVDESCRGRTSNVYHPSVIRTMRLDIYWHLHYTQMGCVPIPHRKQSLPCSLAFKLSSIFGNSPSIPTTIPYIVCSGHMEPFVYIGTTQTVAQSASAEKKRKEKKRKKEAQHLTIQSAHCENERYAEYNPLKYACHSICGWPTFFSRCFPHQIYHGPILQMPRWADRHISRNEKGRENYICGKSFF